MARRRPIEDDPDLQRWMISWADFLTLLFAFFVVMYGISSVNQ
ncbi:MAG: flagellar motor protein MotD, partial [Oceanospirillaceae bacterium]|nr:flagellar motor protein MotD [Oceanospirillaceae bacterium]